MVCVGLDLVERLGVVGDERAEQEALGLEGRRGHLHARIVARRPVEANDYRTPAALWQTDGRLALIDSLPDSQSGASDHQPPAGDRSLRRLDDGRTFTVVKVHRTAAEVAAAIEAAGLVDVDVRSTGRFFLLATAVRPATPAR